MSVEIDPALNGLVGSSTTQQLDGLDYRINLFWLDAETNAPWSGPATFGSASVASGGTYVGPDGSYQATQASTTGTGSGGFFELIVVAGEVVELINVINRGSGYQVGEIVTVTIQGQGLTENVAATLEVSLVFAEPGAWSCSVRASDGTALVLGQILRHGADILAGMTSIPGVPQGRIIAWDFSGNSRDPGRNDLDPETDVRLVYRTAADVGRG